MAKFIIWLLALTLVNNICAQQTALDSNIVLYFSGDVTLANHFENHVGDDIPYAFARLKWFSEADISMVNLENPLTNAGEAVEKKFTFRARPDYVEILKDGGVDIVTLANNHIYDFGADGLLNTLNILDQRNIHFVGAGRDINEARHPVIFYIKGLRIAYFAYYGTHKHSDSYPASPDSAGTALRQLPIIKEDILKFRNSVDFIIINFHWGTEKAEVPGEDQVYFAHQVIDYGADVIVGHHPHVLQGIEIYKNKVIAYSLGNFIFGGNSRSYYDTVVLKIKLSGRDSINTSIIPVGVNYWQPEILSGEKKKSVMESVKELSAQFEKSIF